MNITNEDKIKGYIYSNQMSMFGHKEIIGYGINNFYVTEIDRILANEIIIKNHYSKKVFNNSYIHLGVFINSELLGVLQFGHLMNPASANSTVNDSDSYSCLELNRMWLDDKAKRNSESKAISYSIKYIKGTHKKIKWIQSFADERCGGLGIVYQACSFRFYGEHISEFYVLDNEYYHSTYFTNTKGKSSSKSKNAIDTRKRIKECKKETLRQFRYIKFLDSRWVKKCNHKEKPYLKHYNND
jgi:hypothetical protein